MSIAVLFPSPRRRALRRTGLALLLVAAALALRGPAPSAAATPAADAPDPRAAPGEILASFHAPPDPTALDQLGLTLIDHSPGSNVTRLRAAAPDPRAAIARLRASGLTAWAEPNGRLQVAGLIPDDPRYGEQAAVWELLGAPDAWAITTGSREVVVAVIDGGVDLDHPDLAANIWTNPGEIPGNGIDDDANGYIDDVHGYDFVGDFPGGDGSPGEDANPDVFAGDPAAGDGIDQDGDGAADVSVGHGTRVAGIIAARGNDAWGVAGTAWRVRIMPVRVTDPEGSGFISSFVRGLEYATANGADIVNISLAATFLPQAAQAAVRAAAAAGVILVAAGGNDGGLVAFPAAMPEVIAVGSHGAGDQRDMRAPFSPSQSGVALVAPGFSILTTEVLPVSAAAGFTRATGSSYSAAFVSGAVALALSLEPGLDQAAVLELLSGTATPLPDGPNPGWDGAGRLHIAAAIARLHGATPGAPLVQGIDLDAPDADFVVRGRARPGGRIDLLVSPDDVRTSGVADAEGRFRIALPRDRVPERRSLLTITAWAVAPDPAGGAAEERASPASAPITVALPHMATLTPGWNLVAWAGATGSGADVLADLPPGVQRVFAWQGRGWQLAIPGDPRFQIGRIRAGDGLWLFLAGSEPAQWPQRRARIPERTLTTGWHLLAWPGGSGAAAGGPGSVAGRLEVFVWDAESANPRGFTRVAPGRSPSLTVRHLDAVWVFVAAGRPVWPGSW